MADRLRRTLFDAATASRDVALLAPVRCSANNTPHGLCMFDSEGRIVRFRNQALVSAMGLPSGQLKGLSLRCLLERSVE